ncbi:hypothetical protein OESDEN_03426 [Oesophagostomum dentatum]|uniref:glucuronosyltransferase n=1 Tax=Oesophagostomum dentatum TaxID=61180 RepID=A0A0B1TKL9_OESDE|nr:hypothetical protein OESDEN_03426 [Oesophagostomum dentatum]
MSDFRFDQCRSASTVWETKPRKLWVKEAINAAVPVIAVPLFSDQSKNALLAEHHGFGLILQKNDLSVETISDALKKITSDTRYATAVKTLSKMVNNKPVSAAHLLVKWSEFVAEFKTLENLEPAGNKLNFFQYYSLDLCLRMTITTFKSKKPKFE